MLQRPNALGAKKQIKMRRLLGYVGYCFLLASCSQKAEFIGFTYPEGKLKALVLSYDDGTIQDIELAALFDRHQLIGTFNLNSEYLGATRGWPQANGDTIFQKYVPKDSLLVIYKNHEISAHGAFHKDFLAISDDEILEEVYTDIENLANLTNREITSMAYPFGNTNEHIAQLILPTGITNARTVAVTYAFDLPENRLLWNPTCHDSKVSTSLDAYLSLEEGNMSVFYVWGHSWEFGDKERWDNMVAFCERIGKEENIWSVGAGELTHYLKAIERVQIDKGKMTNPTGNTPVWIRLSTGIERLDAGETLAIKISG